MYWTIGFSMTTHVLVDVRTVYRCTLELAAGVMYTCAYPIETELGAASGLWFKLLRGGDFEAEFIWYPGQHMMNGLWAAKVASPRLQGSVGCLCWHGRPIERGWTEDGVICSVAA